MAQVSEYGAMKKYEGYKKREKSRNSVRLGEWLVLLQPSSRSSSKGCFLIPSIMRPFLLASLASLVAVQSSNAHPLSLKSRMLARRAVDLNAFRMVLDTEYTNATTVQSDPSISSLAKRADPQDTATELVKTTVPGATFRLVEDHYVGGNGVAHFNFKQTASGLDIDNADFNVNVSHFLKA